MLYLAQDVEHIGKDLGMQLISDYEYLSKRISSLMNTLQ